MKEPPLCKQLHKGHLCSDQGVPPHAHRPSLGCRGLEFRIDWTALLHTGIVVRIEF